MRREAKHRRIAKELGEGIGSGLYRAGSMLPSEHVLCDLFHTSRYTVRTALRRLGEQGLVRNLPGRGWQVRRAEAVARPEPGQCRGTVVVALRDEAPAGVVAAAVREVISGFGFAVQALPILRENDPAGYQQLRQQIDQTTDLQGILVFDDSPAPAMALPDHLPILGLALADPQKYDTMVGDYFAGSNAMVAHVFRRGHRRIAFVGDAEQHAQVAGCRDRLAGYRRAVRDRELPEICWLMTRDVLMDIDLLLVFLRERIAADGLPDCCFTSGHRVPEQLAQALDQLGYAVPEAVSLTGIGGNLADDSYKGLGFQRLCMLVEPCADLGRIAA